MKLMIVIPCYNEEQVLPETAKRLTAKMRTLIEGGLCGADSRVLLVDDGSKDKRGSSSPPCTRKIRCSKA